MQNIIFYVATVIIWGTTFFAVKLQLGEVDPFVSITYRFALAGALLLAYCAATGRLKQRLTKVQHLWIAAMGLSLFSLNYVFTYFGTGYIPSGLVALCFSTITIMNILNQRLFFKIPVNGQVMLGTGVGLCGMALTFLPEISHFSFQNDFFKGLMLCLIGSYSASLGNMVSVKMKKLDTSVVLSSALGMTYGAGFTLLFCLIKGSDFIFSSNPAYIGSLLYLAIPGSVVAFLCYLTLIRNIGADKAAYTSILFPIIAMTISTFWEGYHLELSAYFGIALILIGNFVAMRKSKAQKALMKLRG